MKTLKFKTVKINMRRAFAIYSADDNSFTFYADFPQNIPEEGSQYKGKEVTNIYIGFEKTPYSYTDVYPYSDTPWAYIAEDIDYAEFDESFKHILPLYTANWFENFTKMTEIINLEYLNTSNVRDMNGMFGACYLLQSVDTSNWNTSNVTDMNGMFGHCESLSFIDTSSWNTSKVTDMNYMFGGCYELQSLDTSNWDTSNVTNMYEMFHRCRSLTSLDVSTWDTSQVTDMYGMFYQCGNLTSLDVSAWDTSQVTDMYGVFEDCTPLISLDVSNWDTSQVTDMSRMFNGCTNLQTIYSNDDNFTTSKVSSSQSMFYNCTSLVGGNGTRYNSEQVDASMAHCDTTNNPGYFKEKAAYLREGTYINETFKQLSGQSDATYNTENTLITNIKYYNGTPIIDDNMSIISVSNSEFPVYAWRDKYGNGLIYYWTEANKIYLNEDSSYMFSRCTSLTSLDINNWDTSNVTDISYIFYHCESLISLDVSHWNTSNVTTMMQMFGYCKSITTLDLSNFDTTNLTATNGMFRECDELITINLGSNFDTSKVTAMNAMFRDSTKLTTIYSNDFSTAAMTNDDNMFLECLSLVGGNGTKFDSSKLDSSMAHIDTSSNPGYFTDPKLKDVELKPLSECTVEEIQKIAQSGYADSVWSIGDTYPITLNGTVGAYTFDNETWYTEIIGFDHNADVETSGLPSVTFQFAVDEDGTRVGFIDDNYNSEGSSDGFKMNTSNTNSGGWESSYMRNTICPQFLAAMPQEWQDIIKPTIKYTDNVGGNSGSIENNVTATEDKIFLLSEYEVFSSYYFSNTYEASYQTPYNDRYSSNRIKYRHSATGSTCRWWERSINPDNRGNFCGVNTNGSTSSSPASNSYGFAPAYTIF